MEKEMQQLLNHRKLLPQKAAVKLLKHLQTEPHRRMQQHLQTELHRQMQQLLLTAQHLQSSR